MFILILYIININIYIFFKLNFVLTTNFFKYLIVMRISQTYRLSWYAFFCLCPGTYTRRYWVNFFTTLTSSCGWSIVRVGTVMTWCLDCWFQYQLVSIFIEQRYFSLTTNSPSVIICPSIVVFYCSIYAPDVNMIT